MANIVELRELSDDNLQEMLENAREEVFNLRFRHATTRLDDVSRLRKARREVAQLETVLNMRRMATEAAVAQPEVAAALAGKKWAASAHFDYEESAWLVEFDDEDGNELATVQVNLNLAQGKRSRRRPAEMRQLVERYEIAG